ncbi:MAG: LysR family transcriptional regulator [Candidatus Eisenbacteria bacterium]|nr:LysR family transcriptional regulator [Candidatus Eisenbacteria bacterium]
MDFETLRCFLSVAELQSFTAAARRHFITQPAVSLRMRSLEEGVGARLIDRAGRRVQLTPAGRLFQARAEEALRQFDRGLAEVGDLLGLKRGRLVLGAIDAAGIDLLPAPLKKFHGQWPNIELVVRVESSGPLVEALVAGELDFAIVTLPVDHSGLIVEMLEEERLILIGPPDVPVRVRSSPARLFCAMPLIAYPRGSVTRGLIDAALERRHLAPRVAMELSHPEAIRGLVEAGLGAAVLPLRVVDRGGPLTRVPGLSITRRLGLVRRASEEPSPAALAFREIVRSIQRLRRPRAGILAT